MVVFNLKGIKGGYGNLNVLKEIDLTMSSSEFIAIIGPNGAGKSTLMKLLARNIKPTSGSIEFRDKPLHKYSARDFAGEVSVVHQFIENIMPFTVYELIRMGRFPNQKLWEIETEKDKEIIEQSINTTRISHLRNRLITELSGGERQLVFIAQALAQSRSVILLDEPISHLDIRHAVQIMDILHTLNKNGSTVITVLHDINIASDYCSRIIALKDGRVFADGTPRNVISYNLIESLFDTLCVIFENPMSKKPYTFPVPGYLKEN